MTGRCGLHRLLALALTVLVAAPLQAQHQVVLLHGFVSSGNAWADTANRLRAEFDAAVTAPDADWRRPYLGQAIDLDSRNILTTPHPVLVGHSNGGQVARNWARLRTPDAIVTIGTPHRGAPLMPQFWNWVVFSSSGIDAINAVGEAFSRTSGRLWVLAEVLGTLDFVGRFSWWTVAYLAASLGLNEFADVVPDMRPDSAAIQLINGAENLEREQRLIGARVGIVSTAYHYYFAGPVRVIEPEWADTASRLMYSSAALLSAWASYVWLTADPGDFDALDVALAMYGVAAHLVAFDAFYCTLVSSVTERTCTPNDGVVPITSQAYPSAANVYIGSFDNHEGSVHTREIGRADVIGDVLRTYTHLPPRVVQPPPPPPGPPPAPEPGPTSPRSPDILAPNQSLVSDTFLRSSGDRFTLYYQSDGNLVLYDATWNPLWASYTDGVAPGLVVMEPDGNLVIYDAGGNVVWMTDTHAPNSRLIVQNDGNVVIYTPDGSALWATWTQR